MRTYTFRGKTQTLPAWARELGVPESTLRSRLGKLGQSVEEAFARPVEVRFRPVGQPSAPTPVRPAPRLERFADGRAGCRWTEDGRRRVRYFGRAGTPEANAGYARFCAEWFANQGRPAPPPGEAVSVAGLVLRFLDWAEAEFVKDREDGRGRTFTSEVYAFRSALGTLNELYGDTPAAAFDPERLRTVQAHWQRSGRALKTCNDYLGRVCRCFAWGVSRKLVPGTVAVDLRHVPRLVPGRSVAPVSEPVRAVPVEHLQLILPHLDPLPARNAVWAAVVQFQLFTRCRPGEACALSAERVDRTSSPWLYHPPGGGKTRHRGRERKVWVGPQAQAVLAEWLDRHPAGPAFRLPALRGSKWVEVNTDKYEDAVKRACAAAGVAEFTPNQIRHTAATVVQRATECDAAVAAALGNTPEVARQVYTDDPADAVAKRIARELG